MNNNLLNMLFEKCPNSQMKENIMNLAKNNDYASIEGIAKNLCKEKGLDPNKVYQDVVKRYHI